MDNISANIASFFATMMGVGASGLVTFYLVDKKTNRLKESTILWYYKSILDRALLLAAIINFYNNSGFKLLKFEEEYPCKQFLIKLMVVKISERSLNHAVKINEILDGLYKELLYMHSRMVCRKKLNQSGLFANDFSEIVGLSRSTLNDIYPIIAEFIREVLNPALSDINDVEIQDAIFILKEDYTPFLMMRNYNSLEIGFEFNQNLLNFFRDFIRLYKLFNKKYPGAIEVTTTIK